jgi:hypothetical protein
MEAEIATSAHRTMRKTTRFISLILRTGR